MSSYSQYGEDTYILSVCPPNGKYLDIGACWPKDLSNTRALYERGWHGVLVEPSPGPLRQLIQEYGQSDRVQIIAGMVSRTPGLHRMTMTDDAVSTESDAVRTTWADVGGYYGAAWVPAVSVAEIMRQFGPFGFVDIDAEGTSVEILDDFLATGARPTCICVEHDGEIVKVERMAKWAGYGVLHINGTNMVLSK
jgi:FkbM family methyltransferase